MTTKAELLKQLEAQEQETAKLRKQIEDMEKPKGRWKPEMGEVYWTLNDDGSAISDTYENLKVDRWRFESGNCFKTEEEAEHEGQRISATQRIKDIILEERGDWVPDWENCSEKVCLAWDSYTGDLDTSLTYSWQYMPNEFYFPEEAEERILERVDVNDWNLMVGRIR